MGAIERSGCPGPHCGPGPLIEGVNQAKSLRSREWSEKTQQILAELPWQSPYETGVPRRLRRSHGSQAFVLLIRLKAKRGGPSGALSQNG